VCRGSSATDKIANKSFVIHRLMLLSRNTLAAASLLCCLFARAQDAAQAKQWLDEGRTSEAISAYTQLIQASPRDPDLLLFRGLAYSRSRQWSLAITDLEAAAAIAPSYADVWSALGNIYRWNDQPAAAADAYARLASLRPTDPEPQHLRARSLLLTGDLAGAQQAAARARELGASPEAVQSVASALAMRTQANAPDSRGHQWSVSMGAGGVSTANGNAQERSASLRRYTDWGSIAVETLLLRRFDTTDNAVAIDAYPRLWSGAYANVRYQHSASPTWYPGTSWRAELYQGIGQGWEVAASRDYLGFQSRVNIDGVALAKYWGSLYLRWRHQRVSSDASSGSGDRMVVRYYYEGDADHYLEGNVSNGRSDDFSGTLVSGSRSDSRGVVWYHFVTRNWGFKTSWSQSKDTSLPDGRERSLNAGLTYRW
jgi:YaiO family outer membrane protein